MQLTERQKQILSLASSGMLAKECAHKLGVTVRTVEAHRVRAIVQLKARNTVHAVAIAIRHGLIPLVAGMTLGALCFVPSLDIMAGSVRSVINVSFRPLQVQAQCVDEPLHLYPRDERYCTEQTNQ